MDMSWCERLRKTLVHLGAEASFQIEYLTDLDVGPFADELALEFDASLDAARAHVFPDPLDLSLEKLDAALAVMSEEGRESLWSFDAIRTAPEWMEVRQLARSALKSLQC